jgi:hypothetical protein
MRLHGNRKEHIAFWLDIRVLQCKKRGGMARRVPSTEHTPQALPVGAEGVAKGLIALPELLRKISNKLL